MNVPNAPKEEQERRFIKTKVVYYYCGRFSTMDTVADTIEFANIDITDAKYVEGMTFEQRRSLIIGTISDPQIQLVDFQKLMEMGMNVIKLKTSHCTEADRIKMISRIDNATRNLARKYSLLEWPCATCIELKTGTIQTGLLQEDVNEILIETGTAITVTTDIAKFDKCNKNSIFIDDPYLIARVKIGAELNIAQDEIILMCTAKTEKLLQCTVVKGGYLKNMAYVCMRGSKRAHPYITQKDYNLLKFAMEYRVDMIMINYPRSVTTIVKIKKYLGSNRAKRPMLIVGISTQEGLMNLDDFVREADGVSISREFLPYEVDLPLYNRMGRIQSYMSGKCRQAGKPFYISGNVFEELLMTGNLCTKEIADVTHSIMDGASGFILGDFDDMINMCETMKIMNKVCTGVEPLCMNKTEFWDTVSEMKMPVNAAEASAISCAVAANQTKARIIVLPTVSGRTAYLLNYLRPNCLVIGISTKIRTIRQLKMYRSVVPLLYRGPPSRTWFDTVQARVNFALRFAVEKKWIDCGHFYISLEKATEESSFCDAVRIWTVTEKSKRTKMECPESYHDFNVNTFIEPIKKKKSIAKKNTLVSETVTEVVETEEAIETEEAVETEQKLSTTSRIKETTTG